MSPGGGKIAAATLVALVLGLVWLAFGQAPSPSPAEGIGVSTWGIDEEEKPRRCPTAIDLETVRGACVLDSSGGRVRLAVRGLAGQMPLGACHLDFTLHVDADGDTAMDVRLWGPNPCGDVRPCADNAAGGLRPWRGRLTAGPGERRFLNRIRACLDTCVGVFRGRLTMELARVGAGWRARLRRQFVGDSGFWIDGRAPIDADAPSALVLRERRG